MERTGHMKMSPDDVTRFSRPPVSFTDQKERDIDVETYGGDAGPLVEMYEQFDGTAQSQGVPPRTTSQIQSWVEYLVDEGRNVVALHGDRLVGHAILFDYDDTSELAIFVHPDYRSAGVGTRLIRGLLGHGQACGIGHVWLTVSRDNRIAMRLYRSAGFETRKDDRGELEMERNL